MIVVDAGPGTGKTTTVVSRCIRIIRKKDIAAKDVMMLTFTVNAANEMKNRVLEKLSEMREKGDMSQIEYSEVSTKAKQMFIGTFDSFCYSIVMQHPSNISRFFGLEDAVTHNATVTESDTLNELYFKRFLDGFLNDRGKDYGDSAMLVSEDPLAVYSVMNRLMSRGIIPLKNGGWFGGNDGKELVGDPEELRKRMKWSPMSNDLSEEAKAVGSTPELSEYAYLLTGRKNDGSGVGKKKSEEEIAAEDGLMDEAVADDRSEIIRTVHDIYYAFVCKCISEDHLTFGLVSCFAFIILYSDRTAREKMKCRYLTLDEFQDTNANQLMISLMILSEPNLCAVGDWKQGIYGFRFVSVENITKFEDRIAEMKAFLNDDIERVSYDVTSPMRFPITENYRSSQLIIDKAYESLLIPATNNDVISADTKDAIVNISAARDDIGDRTAFETVSCDDRDSEPEEVIRTIERYVHGDKYRIMSKKDDGTVEERQPRYGDIAVLCRTNMPCRGLYTLCVKHGIPAFLQGDMDVMNTREGKLLLAWLRYVNNDNDILGTVPILADLGYSLGDIKEFTGFGGSIPENIRQQRTSLRRKVRRITELLSSIFAFYGLDNDITQTIITNLSASHRSSLLTISDMISMIDTDITEGTNYSLDGLPDSNAVTIQTIHKSKGLEYPIVILFNIDEKSFPTMNRDRRHFTFDPMKGLRSVDTVFHFGEEMKISPSWKTGIVNRCVPRDYDEQRRLLFVALSRAKQYVTMISSNHPSKFFANYTGEGITSRSSDGSELPTYDRGTESMTERPEIPPFRPRRKNLAVHDLMTFGENERPEEGADEVCGRGMRYGTEVHKIAEIIANGRTVPPGSLEKYPEIAEISKVLAHVTEGSPYLRTEIQCSLPFDRENATVLGIIDLLAVYEDRVEVHDWKTDVADENKGEYMIQLSVYAHVVSEYFHRPAVCIIDWLALRRSDRFDPLPMDRLEERVVRALAP